MWVPRPQTTMVVTNHSVSPPQASGTAWPNPEDPACRNLGRPSDGSLQVAQNHHRSENIQPVEEDPAMAPGVSTPPAGAARRLPA